MRASSPEHDPAPARGLEFVPPGPADALDAASLGECRASLEHNSKSFALAARFLPPDKRDAAAVVYAWCRRVDDAVDEVSTAAQPAALAQLRDELALIYSDTPLPRDTADQRTLAAFRAVARTHRIPRIYPEELVAGMAMDVENVPYPDDATLLRYCHRVAGVVGLMMSQVFGVRHERALRHAAHMGWAMQLTNIARDVLEDWERGRLYLPDSRLALAGAPDLRTQLGGPFPAEAAEAVATVVEELLAEADTLYRSGDAGVPSLPLQTAVAVAAAREVYSAIGDRIAAQDHDVRRGRAVVPTTQKLRRVGEALRGIVRSSPRRAMEAYFYGSEFLPVSHAMHFDELVQPHA